MIIIFSITLFMSSILLFIVQPMVSKMILPLLGGTPSVWTTCMLFFQVFLLGGYYYAHIISTRLSTKKQIALHLLLLLSGIFFLPIIFKESIIHSLNWGTNPVFYLLGVLIIGIGLPFFLVSASAPLLLRWFSKTAHQQSSDPYFLYVVSNTGNLLALLAYPFVIEPMLKLVDQSRFWSIAYGFLIFLFLCCGYFLSKNYRPNGNITQKSRSHKKNTGGPSIKRRLFWILLAFIPSSLMLGVTTYLTSDVASVPLLWIIPLILYLLSFIFAFAKKQFFSLTLLVRIFPLAALITMFIILTEIDKPLWLIFTFSIFMFFITAMVCHRRLANDRPEVEYLTHFYLYLAIGGALGGIFNAIIAPVLFKKILELPLILILACFIYRERKEKSDHKKSKIGDYLFPLVIGLFTAVFSLLSSHITLKPLQLWMIVIFGIPLFIGYLFIKRPLRFGLTLLAIFAGSMFFEGIYGKVLYSDRNFFGYIQVKYDQKGPYYRLFHGTTQHGLQFASGDRKNEPLAYYHKTGPLGQIFKTYNSSSNSESVAVVGLGIGSMLEYSTPEQNWTFYEIDPAVVNVAKNSKYFSHIQDAKTRDLKIILGDARLKIKNAENGEYGIIVIDAFNSDVIPIHLMTCEAFRLYISKLANNGLIAMNISNKNLDLTRVIGDIANQVGLICLYKEDFNINFADDYTKGKYYSQWVVMSKDFRNFGDMAKDKDWQILLPQADPNPWTDNYSNIISVLKLF